MEALATSLQMGITINTTTSHSISQHEQMSSFMFGPNSVSPSTVPLSGRVPTIPTYASVLTKGSMSPRRNRHLSTESSGAESMGSLSELMAKQQVRCLWLLVVSYVVCSSMLCLYFVFSQVVEKFVPCV